MADLVPGRRQLLVAVCGCCSPGLSENLVFAAEEVLSAIRSMIVVRLGQLWLPSYILR